MLTGIIIAFVISLACPVLLLGARKKPAGWLERHTDDIDALPLAQLGAWIALASGLSLFAELAFIRFHASCFHLFAYFKNISLLSCFLGLGIGFARSGRRPLATPLVLPLLAVQVLALYPLRFDESFISILKNPIPEQLTLGMATAQGLESVIIAYGFLAVVFLMNALAFVPMGQLIARLMARQRKLVAYSWNLAGSLGGVLLFSAVSYLWTPPILWMIIIGVGFTAFLYRSGKALAWGALALLLMSVILTVSFSTGKFDIYSPYQILSLDVRDPSSPVLETSNSAYQRIHDFREQTMAANPQLRQLSRYYDLPYVLHPNPDQVLIVGSGTGNDVAAALRNGAKNVDAVEIDPVILLLGWQMHPERPYSYSNVKSFVADARSFIRHSDNRYDLIVYGLLDSHVLLSGASGGIRLDSYVYTVEGLREAKNRLAEGGTLCLTFCSISPALAHKIYLMVEEAFGGTPPVVYVSGYAGALTFVAGGQPAETSVVALNYKDLTKACANPELKADVSTDDWPFLYMPERVYPVRYLIMIGLLVVLSVAMLAQLTSVSKAGWSWPCFFLGAGFMLVETKGITELALVYSSTWHVTGIVIMAILVMAFLANLLVMKFPRVPLKMVYLLLSLSLLAGYGITFLDLGGLSLWEHRILMTGMISLPVFFSGLAFSTELERRADVSSALSANILGAMVGGVLEYNSMYFGFRYLYLLALGMYVLAALSSLRASRMSLHKSSPALTES